MKWFKRKSKKEKVDKQIKCKERGYHYFETFDGRKCQDYIKMMNNKVKCKCGLVVSIDSFSKPPLENLTDDQLRELKTNRQLKIRNKYNVAYHIKLRRKAEDIVDEDIEISQELPCFTAFKVDINDVDEEENK